MRDRNGAKRRGNTGIRKRNPKRVPHCASVKCTCIWKLGSILAGKVIVDDSYVGKGYAVPAESTLEAIKLVARKEGILLDPVYNGKAFAGLIGLTRGRFFDADSNVVFLHTGGSAALFAYEDILSGSANETGRDLFSKASRNTRHGSRQ